MLLQRQAELLNEEVRNVIASLPGENDISLLVKEAMTRIDSSQAAFDKPASLWPVLPVMVCEAITGRCEQALPVAAAFQFFRAAGDIFDDIEDADSAASFFARYGFAVSTNLATTLLFLADKSVIGLAERNVLHSVIISVMDAIDSSYLKACAGQHLDLTLPLQSSISEETYSEIAYVKSATSLECACRVAAMVAGASDNLTETFASFGLNLGMASQIANDIQGVVSGTDLVHTKATLPVIFMLNNADDAVKEILLNKKIEQSDVDKIKEIMYETGALHYSVTRMEQFKLVARQKLSEAEALGTHIDNLVHFTK